MSARSNRGVEKLGLSRCAHNAKFARSNRASATNLSGGSTVGAVVGVATRTNYLPRAVEADARISCAGSNLALPNNLASRVLTEQRTGERDYAAGDAFNHRVPAHGCRKLSGIGVLPPRGRDVKQRGTFSTNNEHGACRCICDLVGDGETHWVMRAVALHRTGPNLSACRNKNTIRTKSRRRMGHSYRIAGVNPAALTNLPVLVLTESRLLRVSDDYGIAQEGTRFLTVEGRPSQDTLVAGNSFPASNHAGRAPTCAKLPSASVTLAVGAF